MTRAELENMKAEVHVIDNSQVLLHRIDIATDSNMNFTQNSKLLDFVHKCIRAQDSGGKAWTNVDENSLDDSNYYYHNTDSRGRRKNR